MKEAYNLPPDHASITSVSELNPSARVVTMNRAPRAEQVTRVAILYPTDPAGFITGGIDSFIRGVLKWAPPDVEFTLFGASSDPQARPVGSRAALRLGEREFFYVPVVTVNPTGARARVPLTVRYMAGLYKYARAGGLREFDVLDFHRVEPALLFTRDRRPKNVFMHSDLETLRNPNSDIMWRYAPWLYDKTERWLLRTLDRVFCVRRSAVQRYTKDYPSIAERFEFIPTWVDTDVFVPVASKETTRASVLTELGVDKPARLLTWVGRLDHSKDPLLLVEAFRIARSHTPDLHLVIVGDGVLRKKLSMVCSSDDLRGHVSLVGARRSPEIARFLHASELFVMSSAYEGMPIALLEALATGTPAVTTDVGEVRLVIQDGVNGYVATPRTPETLGNAIRRAVDEADVLRGSPCTRAVEPFRPELVLQRIYETHRREGAALKRLNQPARLGGMRSSR
jgi:glycosyltransferase involved in cell wall biosynthesis